MNTQVKISLFSRSGEGKAIKFNVQNSMGELSVKGYRDPEGATLTRRNTISIYHCEGWFIPEPFFRYIMREALEENGDREFKSGPLTIKLELNKNRDSENGAVSLVVIRNDKIYYVASDTIREIEQRLDQTASLMYSYETPYSSLIPDSKISVMAMMGLEEGRPFRKVCLYIDERYMTKRSFEHIIRLIERSETSPVDGTLRSGPFVLKDSRALNDERHQEISLTITDEKGGILCNLSPNDVIQVRETLVRAKELLHTYSNELLKAYADTFAENTDDTDAEATTET